MILTRKSARLFSRRLCASTARKRGLRELPLKSAWFLALAVACGGMPAKPIAYYACTPGTGTTSVAGRWAGGEFTLELIGTADQLCGSGSLGPTTRLTLAGISGTQARLRWDTICVLESVLGWQPDCSLKQIVNTYYYDVMVMGPDTIQLNGGLTLYRQK
jgi:hypothetical protein